MNFFFEKIPLQEKQSFIIREFEVPAFNYPMHFHPEYEITLIKSGTGTRYVGDSVSEFTDGDLLLTGHGLPHQYRNYMNTSGASLNQVVLQLNNQLFDDLVLQINEFQSIKLLLQKSAYGMAFGGNTKKRAESILQEIMSLQGFQSILKVFELLDLMSLSEEGRQLSKSKYSHESSKSDDRINPLFDYMLNHFDEQIQLNDLAKVLHISPSAVSHFIRKKTGKTFTEYLNEIRIGHSCKLLTTTNLSIGEIAYKSGLNNATYYNRCFKKIKNMTPSQFRKKYSVDAIN